ncbi:MAG: arsenate reductase (glutaredoxin) [Bacteroidetes bacterium]|jgi:arsenate reductase|nr:arsenate reductase (glutaredoxin) [Bacteroidota bacterium]
MEIWHNPRCKKSRETLQRLEEAGIEPTIRKYLETPPSERQLSQVMKMMNIKPTDLIRKQEKIFKENFKGKDFSDHEWITIMVNNPILIERPVVIDKNRAILGRPPENVDSLI